MSWSAAGKSARRVAIELVERIERTFALRFRGGCVCYKGGSLLAVRPPPHDEGTAVRNYSPAPGLRGYRVGK